MLIAAIAWGAVAVVGANGEAREFWFRAAFVDPKWDIPVRSVPPFPAPEWNPFALYGSGIGVTLCGLVANGADRAEHLGAISKPEMPFVTRPARWTWQLEKDLQPKFHLHASDAEHEQGRESSA
jgi:hypothetical protein